MGCDLKRQAVDGATPSERIPMGSDRSIHAYRKLVVLLTARHYLKASETQTANEDMTAEEAMSLFPGDYPDDWVQALLAWTKVHFPLPDLWDIAPDYSAVSDAVRDERLEGLRKFVDHSDCDGRHSRGDVADIAALFEQVQPDADEVLVRENHEWFERVARFFIAARDAHEFITYC